jgi:hypothetical protein
MDSSPNAYKVSCVGHVLNPNIKKVIDVSSWNFVNIHTIFDLVSSAIVAKRPSMPTYNQDILSSNPTTTNLKKKGPFYTI